MPPTEELPTSVANRLAEAGVEVYEAEEQLRKARNRLDSAVYDAVTRKGCQVAEVARTAGISRETVYKATGRRA